MPHFFYQTQNQHFFTKMYIFKKYKEGLKHALHVIFDHNGWPQSQKKRIHLGILLPSASLPRRELPLTMYHKVALEFWQSIKTNELTKPGNSPFRPLDPNRWASLVLHGSPWGYMCLHCHQIMTQAWPKATQRASEVSQNRDFSANPSWPEKKTLKIACIKIRLFLATSDDHQGPLGQGWVIIW